MKNKTIRFLLNIVIVYFLAMILVLANGTSILGKIVYPYFYVVANSMGLNTSWNFFSPDPAHIIYLKSLIIYPKDKIPPTAESEGEEGASESNQDLRAVTEYYPVTKDEGEFGLTSRRDSYASRFFMIDRSRIETFYAPWVCKKHPGAVRVAIEGYLLTMPSLERATTELSVSIEEMLQEISIHQVDYNCEIH